MRYTYGMTIETIIFTGGGSGGHVLPALTLISELKKMDGLTLRYIGGKGIESQLVPLAGVVYKKILTGKLRRYFSWENFTDIFKLAVGFGQSFFFLIKFKKSTTVLLSTGGFVSVPVVMASKILGVTVYLHEQTTRIGLANKICSIFAKKVFISFKATKKFLPESKSLYTGYPVREGFYKKEGKKLYLKGINFDELRRPLLFVTGGGNGSKLINELIRKNLSSLKAKYMIVHQVGAEFLEEYSQLEDDEYLVYSFLGDEMVELIKKADVVISRSGAGIVCELLACQKRSLFIPLKNAQKNEQYHNAMEAFKKLGSIVIEEDYLDEVDLSASCEDIVLYNQSFCKKNYHFEKKSATQLILSQLLSS